MIQNYSPGEHLPVFNIQLEWIGHGPQRSLSHRVSIIGARGPNNYFTLRYREFASDTHESKNFKVMGYQQPKGV